MPRPCSESRLRAANQALSLFTRSTRMEWRRGRGWVVIWNNSSGELVSRRWQRQRGSHYVTWYRSWGHGGTCMEAMFQIVQWLNHLPVLPLGTWKYWTSKSVAIARERGQELVDVLEAAGWPTRVHCVVCAKEITTRLDWWDSDGLEGPCCMFGDCEERARRAAHVLAPMREEGVQRRHQHSTSPDPTAG